MKLIAIITLWGTILGVASCSTPQKVAPPQSELGWFGGCWLTEDGTREVWSVAAPELLFGYNLVHRDGKVVFFEQLRLQKTTDGWTYYAYPGGRGPTMFTSMSVENNQHISFINEEHDYPQLISYAREQDTLTAQISYASGENPRRWVYNRCDPK